MKALLLFDVDGTLTESSEPLCDDMSFLLNFIKQKGYEIGTVGGGKFDKILEQLGETTFHHYFSECGSVYHDESKNEIYRKNIRKHSTYTKINKLLKCVLRFLSEVNYTITGNFIDLRSGLVYISLIGMVANNDERKYFMDLDKRFKYRERLLALLREKAKELGVFEEIDIVYGGSVGIAIYPKEFDKIQIFDSISKENYSEIHYFGDKYLPDGNDYRLLNCAGIIGHRVNDPNDTMKILVDMLKNM